VWRLRSDFIELCLASNNAGVVWNRTIHGSTAQGTHNLCAYSSDAPLPSDWTTGPFPNHTSANLGLEYRQCTDRELYKARVAGATDMTEGCATCKSMNFKGARVAVDALAAATVLLGALRLCHFNNHVRCAYSCSLCALSLTVGGLFLGYLYCWVTMVSDVVLSWQTGLSDKYLLLQVRGRVDMDGS
jgi:hypothetical protein